MADTLPSFCVVLPMYNERDNAEVCIARVAEFLTTVPSRTGIIAVDDGSSDDTGEILRRLGGPDLHVVSHSVNGGYGAANRSGFMAALSAGYDYALVMDADCTQHPAYIARFFEPMRLGVDLIKATRYARGGGVEGVPWRRRAVSWAGNRLARLLMPCGLSDYTNGFRALSAALLRRLETKECGFAMLMEEVREARRLGATFSEVPYLLTVRKATLSGSKFVYSLNVYSKYLGYLLKAGRSK